MTKKFVIEEIWLLDKDGNKVMELTPFDINTIPSLLEEDSIKGGYGKIENNGQNE